MSQVIQLTFPQISLINCLGIQPIFHDNYKIDESYLGFVYRNASHKNRGGTMRYAIKSRIGDENDIIIKNKFHISEATSKIIRFIGNNCFTLKHNGSLDELMKNDDLLKETLWYYLKRIELYISVGQGNFLITSRKDLYNKKLFSAQEIANFQIHLVDEKLLPRDTILIGHKNCNVFCNPYAICPLIDKKHFDEICKLNKINLRDFDVIDKKSRYPLMDRRLNLFSLYQSYLDNVKVQEWYIEQFNNPTETKQKSYYTLVKFD